MMKMRFPPRDRQTAWEQTRRLRVLLGRDFSGITDHFEIIDNNTLSGYTRANTGGVPLTWIPLTDSELKEVTHGQVSFTNGGFNISYSMRFDGLDLEQVAIPLGTDPVSA